MIFPAMTFPFVLRTFDAMVTLLGAAGGTMMGADPLAMLSHIFYY
jgi:hypothetical protein